MVKASPLISFQSRDEVAKIPMSERTYFVTQTWGRRQFLQSDRMAALFVSTLQPREIRTAEEFEIARRYIHNNPVKAGVVAKASDHRFSSASDWLSDRSGLVKIDKSFSWT